MYIVHWNFKLDTVAGIQKNLKVNCTNEVREIFKSPKSMEWCKDVKYATYALQNKFRQHLDDVLIRLKFIRICQRIIIS